MSNFRSIKPEQNGLSGPKANRRWAIVGREDQWARLRDQADPGRGSPSGDLLRGSIRLEEQEDPHRQESVKEAERE